MDTDQWGNENRDANTVAGYSPDDAIDAPVIDAHLGNLGIASLDTWDVLVFLFHHRTSLLGAAQIARLLGYPAAVTGRALDTLESLGLIRRSRADRGVSLVQLTCSREVLEPFAEHRAGRILIEKTLPATNLTENTAAKGA